jgi:hypothetical protein
MPLQEAKDGIIGGLGAEAGIEEKRVLALPPGVL